MKKVFLIINSNIIHALVTFRARLIARIESVTSSVIQQICSGRLPKISSSLSHNRTATDTQMPLEDDPSASNLESQYPEEAEEIEEANEPITKKSSTDFVKKGSKGKFALTMTVMATAHHLLLTNTTITRRSLYYDLKNKKTLNLVPEQRCVDQAVNRVANLLNCAPWELSECLSYFLFSSIIEPTNFSSFATSSLIYQI